MRAAWMANLWLCVVCVASSAAWASAPELDFRPPATVADPSTPAVMRDLAERLLPVYQDLDSDRYLTNLSALQLVAGNYAAAAESRQSLRERRRRADANRPINRSVIYDIYAFAKANETEGKVSFAQAFTKAYRDWVPRLSDLDAYSLTKWFETPLPVLRDNLQKAFDQQRPNESISQSDAVQLLWTYLAYDAFRNFGPLVDLLDAADDRARYSADNEILIKTADGATLSAVLVRPNGPAKPLPALLEFTFDDTQNYAMECAAHGYIGVVAYPRGNGKSGDQVLPFQKDGEDARAVIDWIAKQPWSDGRVGMYGEGYGAFAAWAAAKRVPPALKAIATSAATAPGIDMPMTGNIFQNSAYRWSLCATNSKESVEDSCSDEEAWRALDQKWYRSGKRYRDLGRTHGEPNPIFIRWLNHPSYDLYWQKMIPYREQFSHIGIPVLSMTGYYAAGEAGDLYYFTQHTRFDRHADHTLVIGPYEDGTLQGAIAPVLHGYQLDSAAAVDLHELRYQWFDHVLKGAAVPPLLTDHVNYEVMGANEWQHAASIEAMANGSLKLFFGSTPADGTYPLTQRKPVHPAVVHQTVSLTDRSDAGWMPPTELVSKSLAVPNGVMFESDALPKATEVSGLFSGRLDFTVNKMDVDLNITLYEHLAQGDYVRLFSPRYEFRASYARDRVHRHLLEAGVRQALAFKSERITSRQLQAGSRLVMVLAVSKRPDREINYGTGNDVSEDSIADGKTPIRIRWLSDSYIDIPIRK
jgi:putative CocE/NonD family hydrolase